MQDPISLENPAVSNAVPESNVQSLKELKKSRRTVMLGTGLNIPTTATGTSGTMAPPLTPPLSVRTSGDVEEFFDPDREDTYESVDLSSEASWDGEQPEFPPTPDDEIQENAELSDRSEKSSLPSLRKILETTPEAKLVESLPSPPPITVHDFWANVVRNYRLVQRTMPGFLFHKIRDGGIPSVLRRVVWTAMAGITSEYMTQMSQVYARLEVGGVDGGWERDIARDLNRTWPEVHMFKEQDGEGQKGLRGVLGAYSVWDHEVGYCQGLGFLAGPLLMVCASPAEAFTLLTVLMAQPQPSSTGYSLRTLYTPNFPGLLSLIHSFTSTFTTHFPTLSAHLTSLGVSTEMYAPPWFLSLFAVTSAPIDTILFRIWDLLLMEGSHGGYVMIRVGLALMKIHQDRLLEMTEMEEVLKLLLSKDLWTGVTGDSLVDNTGGEMKQLVPLVQLQKLDEEYALKTKVNEKKPGSDIQAVAGRFLRKLKWTTGETMMIVPPPMLRTLSKASFSSSSQDTSEPSTLLRTQTDGVVMSRSASSASFRGTSENEKALHAQIEDLMKLLCDTQRKLAESELDRDGMKTENVKLRDTLSRVVDAVGGPSVEELNIPAHPDTSLTLRDEISDILSSSTSSVSTSSISSCSGSSIEEDLRVRLSEAHHLVDQERQANVLLQQQLSVTENELSRSRAALMELRTKYTEAARRERTPSNESTRSTSGSPLRELKLVVRTASESNTVSASPSTPTPSTSTTSAGSSWGGWFGRH